MLKGELVNLRAIEPADAALLHGWLDDPDLMRFWGHSEAAISHAETARRVAGWIHEEAALGYPVAFVIEDLDGDPVGFALLGQVSPRHRSAEISLFIADPTRRGVGLGPDALAALVEAAFSGWNLERLTARCEAFNEPAQRMVRHAGFHEEARLREARYLDGAWHDIVAFALLRDDVSPPTSHPAASAAQDLSERFDVLRSDGTPTGITRTRGEVHRAGDWHRSVHVWVIGGGEDGWLVFQRRSAAKDTWPRRLDASVSGHYRAGEGLDEALRETAEEIGVAAPPAELIPLGVRVYVGETEAGIHDRELQDIFLWPSDRRLTDWTPHPDELESLVRVRIADLLALCAGDVDAIGGEQVEVGRPGITSATVTRDDFIPSVDAYVYRVAVAAQRALRGERYLVI